jgi:hypothetical protein
MSLCVRNLLREEHIKSNQGENLSRQHEPSDYSEGQTFVNIDNKNWIGWESLGSQHIFEKVPVRLSARALPY